MVQVTSNSPLVFTLNENEIRQTFLEERMDLGFYHPKYGILSKITSITKYPIKMLEEIAEISRILGFEVDQYVEYVTNGIPYLRVQNIKEFELDLNDVKKISRISHEKLMHSQLVPGDVIVTTTGRVGTAAVIPNELKEANASNQTARIRVGSKIDPNYVSSYLNSRLGRLLLEQWQSGSTRPRILIKNMRKLIIIVPPLNIQQKIVNEIMLLHKQRKLIMDKADSIKIQLKNINSKEYSKVYDMLGITENTTDEGVFEIRPSFPDDRFDVQYFMMQNRFTLNSKYLSCKMTDLIEFSNETIHPEKDSKLNIKYVEISDVDAEDGEIKSYKEFIVKDAPSRARKIIHSGEIITCMSGSATGTINHVTAIVEKKYDNFVVTTGFGVLKPKKGISLKFIYHMLRSDFVLSEIKRRLTGATIPSIRNDSFLDIPMINPPRVVQDKIVAILDNAEYKSQQVKSEYQKAYKQIEELQNKSDNRLEYLLIH